MGEGKRGRGKRRSGNEGVLNEALADLNERVKRSAISSLLPP